MIEWIEQVIRTSWQQRLQALLAAHPYWAFVSIVAFVTTLIHMIVQLMFEGYIFSLLFTIGSVVAGSILFVVKYYNKQGWLTGSWPVRICIELWNHDEDEE
ncbi:hypothetical protein LOK74_13835 [Brevibacillus humidisoli]|uniref:hypothetical protein n=1 Tax=Brevibacillus humidisoli TaxID=2895522 RepID=UPI001E2AFE80|nr:hypothetical protein [Brevibacillus humidisoli]UFJ39150.1 hypothetical protein LOK74_13835 [Brevibacillus humidisoli]